uniref:Uncharacterized protein n=1 Tax=Ralstonia solanacearum TaxID=305 RepID=A0A0S4W5M1_RALSL|nr:protein of unknown function [Ralstonia solanacearum]
MQPFKPAQFPESTNLKAQILGESQDWLDVALAAENPRRLRIRGLIVWLDDAVLRPASLELFG